MMKNRVVVYTTIFNNYDTLNDPPIFYKDVDYVCFTDSKKLNLIIGKLYISK